MTDAPAGLTREQSDLRAVYDEQLRGDAEVQGSVRSDRDGPLWRGVFTDGGFVSYESLEPLGSVSAVEEAVARTVAYFSSIPQVKEFEWKTRGHDWPDELDGLLRDHGFEPDEVETVMVGLADRLAVEVDLPDGVVVRRVDDQPDAEELIAAAADMQQEVFGAGSSADEVLDRLARMEGRETYWIAEADGVVVTAGRLNRVAGTEFAGLWGGATRPEWRGRGIYRALTAARARYAIDEGVRYIHSDCSAMSRPILERSGLVAVTTTTPYVWRRPTPA